MTTEFGHIVRVAWQEPISCHRLRVVDAGFYLAYVVVSPNSVLGLGRHPSDGHPSNSYLRAFWFVRRALKDKHRARTRSAEWLRLDVEPLLWSRSDAKAPFELLEKVSTDWNAALGALAWKFEEAGQDILSGAASSIVDEYSWRVREPDVLLVDREAELDRLTTADGLAVAPR